jgi:hypothetical protein
MRVEALSLDAAAALGMQAQDSTGVDVLVQRLGRYLVEYENQLSTVVAEERYGQSVVQLKPGALRETATNSVFRTRTLEPEVPFCDCRELLNGSAFATFSAWMDEE